jgi:broad specificity phosphatase PhoE
VDVYVIRHGFRDGDEDALNDKGVEVARRLSGELPAFAEVYSSAANRARQTAELLSGRAPEILGPAGIPLFDGELVARLSAKRTAHAFGIGGVLFDTPEAHASLDAAGQALASFIVTKAGESGDGAVLIVSHDGTMLAAERKLRNQPIASPTDHTYRELQGFVVSGGLELSPVG